MKFQFPNPDLRPHLSGCFDTSSGSKLQDPSIITTWIAVLWHARKSLRINIPVLIEAAPQRLPRHQLRLQAGCTDQGSDMQNIDQAPAPAVGGDRQLRQHRAVAQRGRPLQCAFCNDRRVFQARWTQPAICMFLEMQVEAGSYNNIALSLGVDDPGDVLFATGTVSILGQALGRHILRRRWRQAAMMASC